MKIYAAHITVTEHDGGDGGMSFWSSKRAAKKDATKSRKIGHEATVLTLEVTATKRGIISLLNRYANHPDNG